MSRSSDNGRPIQVAEGIFWVGADADPEGLACNPYLIVEGDRAALIDSGSRTDFAVVMMRILQTGIDPRQIVALIYQHYDPDLCGSMANFIDMCDNPDLRIVSENCNNAFISFYIHRDHYHLLRGVEEYGHRFPLGQRRLEFIPTPYAHSAGSFATYDPRTGTLFTSDLFGSYSRPENLLLEFDPACFECDDWDHCPLRKTVCPLKEPPSTGSSCLAPRRCVMPSAG